MPSHDNFIRVAASGATEIGLKVPTVSAPLTKLALRAAAAALVMMATSPAGAQSGPADGQKLAFDRGKGNCLTCHDIRGGDLPGTIGPKLENIKSKYPDRGDLVAILTDETKRNPQTVMPPFGRNRILTEQEISAIVDFLQTL
jgi:sulfur-oxidizing protein SoxX